MLQKQRGHLLGKIQGRITNLTTFLKRILRGYPLKISGHHFLMILVTLAASVTSSCSNGVLSKASEGIKRELPLGRAGSANEALLASVYEQTSLRAPAAIRPDPDTYIRTLLRQYREEGPIIAREIGRVEDYRALLGGANEDFSKAPQLTYDATSLLAVQKVAEEICTGLIAPNNNHPGWSTILPAAPGDVQTNLRFLAQRFIGLPSDRIGAEVTDGLEAILNLSLVNGQITLESYVSVCVALSVDAEALLL